MLLIMGLGMQLTAWPAAAGADARGARLSRHPHRQPRCRPEPGLRRSWHAQPGLGRAALRCCTCRCTRRIRWPTWPPTHSACSTRWASTERTSCGASMGGMVAQHMAAGRPERVSRLTLMMTTSGARRLPQPTMKVRAALIDRRGAGAHGVDARGRATDARLHADRQPRLSTRPAGSSGRACAASVQRAWRPSGVARQLLAVVADGDRSPLLSRIRAPTAHRARRRRSARAGGRGARPARPDRRARRSRSSTAWATICRRSCCPAWLPRSVATRTGRHGGRQCEGVDSDTAQGASSELAQMAAGAVRGLFKVGCS